MAFAIMFGWGILMDPGTMDGRLTFVAGALGMAFVLIVDLKLHPETDR